MALRLAFHLLLFLACLNVWADSRTIQSLSAGPPACRGVTLAAETFVEVQAQRLAHPEILWVNLDYLRKQGFDVPPEGLAGANNQLRHDLLEAFAWAVPNAQDAPELFGQESKTFYADRYGGTGTGNNWGSGRAAAAGQIQIKGIGITPLVGRGQSFDHAHGRASIEEAIREAIWGEITQDLPYGSNRVIAIIATGTSTRWSDGGQESNALIVREFPLRPAHYMSVENTASASDPGTLRSNEAKRVAANNELLPRALPQQGAPRLHSLEQQIQQGFQNYADRVAAQYAALFARKLYHGATSPSNIELSGRVLDFGTMTSQPRHDKIRILSHNDAAGETAEISTLLLEDFAAAARRNATPDVASHIPHPAELQMRFSKHYNSALERELLKLSGVPELILDKLQKQDSKALTELASELKRRVLSEALSFNMEGTQLPLNSFDLSEFMLKALNAEPRSNTNPKRLEGKLVHFYQNALNEAALLGLSHKVASDWFGERLLDLGKARAELYRSTLRTRSIEVANHYLHTQQASIIWNFIEETVHQNQPAAATVCNRLLTEP